MAYIDVCMSIQIQRDIYMYVEKERWFSVCA